LATATGRGILASGAKRRNVPYLNRDYHYSELPTSQLIETLKMAPKKKARAATAAASTPTADEEAMAIDTPQPQTEEPPKPAYDILKDPWTDEQETSLFKGIIKWKPAGEFIASHQYGTLANL
jgi:hypothetical protein